MAAGMSKNLWKRKTVKIVRVNLLVFLALVLLIEGICQLITLFWPSYDVLFVQPDKAVGWKHVPDFQWTWAGMQWYANDFSVKVKTNSLGFRDKERQTAKPPGARRVAILGDSLVEALQVPFEKTAAQLLEKRLNALPRQKWEVLNFGTSCYAIGQCLLAWEEYVRPYRPEYVVVLVGAHMLPRTVEKYEAGAFPDSAARKLWIRPTFRIENNALIREPARDYDEFVKAQERLINAKFGGKRSQRRTRLHTANFARLLPRRLKELTARFSPPPKRAAGPPAPGRAVSAEFANTLAVNLEVLKELGRKAAGEDSRLVVVDMSRYGFATYATIPSALMDLCAENGFGYIPFHEDIWEANRNGIATRWEHDGHFNEAGNELLAAALYRWMALNAHPPCRIISPSRGEACRATTLMAFQWATTHPLAGDVCLMLRGPEWRLFPGTVVCQNGYTSVTCRIPADLTSGTYRLRISWMLNTRVYWESEPFQIFSPPQCAIKSPSEGATYRAGEPMAAQWTTTNNPLADDMYLSLRGPQWRSLGGTVACRNGETSVTRRIPADLTSGTYQLRISWTKNFGVFWESPAFTVTP